MSNFTKEFIVVNLHFSVPLLIMVLLMFYFKEKKHFFSVFYSGVFAFFVNFFIQGIVLFFIKRYFYDHWKEVNCYQEGLFGLSKADFMKHRYVLTLLYVYQAILKYFVFAFFCIVFKIIVFRFLLKNKKVDDFKKALYFSIGSSFLTNPFWRFLAINHWFELNTKVLKSELFLLGINSLSIFVFEFSFSLLILYIIRKTENLKRVKKIFLCCLLYGLLVIVNGVILYILRMPDTLPYRDVIAVRYNLNFENEVALGMFLVFVISVILSLKNVLLEKNVEKSLK